MLENIFELLRLAKEEGLSGEYIDVALGKNKYPESIKDVYLQFKQNIKTK